MQPVDPKQPAPLLDRPAFQRRLFLGLLALCVLLALVDFLPGYDKHPHFAFEQWPLLYPVFGVAAYLLVVTVGKCLRKVAARPEDYYD